MKAVYKGPHDAVDLPTLGLTITRGDVVDLPADVVAELAAAGFEPIADLKKLTVEGLKQLAAAKDIDITGITKKADLIAALTEEN